jgi:hypothetical protein
MEKKMLFSTVWLNSFLEFSSGIKMRLWLKILRYR